MLGIRSKTLLWLLAAKLIFSSTCVLGFSNSAGRSKQTKKFQSLADAETGGYGNVPKVWVEEAEEGFVDEDENLEEGEECLVSLKAFASNPSAEGDDSVRFLCAGALVKRPESLVCDAWTADSILDEGGPNLQLQGAVKVLDALLLHHLRNYQENPILGLQTFVLKCGVPDSEYTCSSYMAATSRGFRPLKDMVRIDSIYSSTIYDNDLDGMVLEPLQGRAIYEQIGSQVIEESPSLLEDKWRASSIFEALPDEDTIRRCTSKRFTSK